MVDRALQILSQQFGDHFIGIIVIIIFIFIAIRRGVHEVQGWIKNEVLDPYLAPTIAKVASHENIQTSHTELLVDHEKRIRHEERISRILQGKVMGAEIHINDEEI